MILRKRKTTRRRRARPSRTGATARPDLVRVKFWGVRGSIPAAGRETLRYGGNTPCVEVRCGGQLILFDFGTGARLLGEQLRTQSKPVAATVFMSHYHYDHVQGLPFFAPIYRPENTLSIFGPSRGGRTVREILSGQMVRPYFPVDADLVFKAQVDYREIRNGEGVRVGGALVTARELNHPGGTFGYRVEYRERVLVYATDVEHGSPLDETLCAFAQDADLLILDAMYTDDEYEGRSGPSRRGWGHATWKAALALADRARARRLVLFHHDPAHSDSQMDAILREARRRRPGTLVAREGLELRI